VGGGKGNKKRRIERKIKKAPGTVIAQRDRTLPLVEYTYFSVHAEKRKERTAENAAKKEGLKK